MNLQALLRLFAILAALGAVALYGSKFAASIARKA